MDILTDTMLWLYQSNAHLGDSLMTAETKKVILMKKMYASKYSVLHSYEETIFKTFQNFLKFHVYLLSLSRVLKCITLKENNPV